MPVWGLPKELAAPNPCAAPGSDPNDEGDPELDATSGEPKELAAPAFCSAPGSEPNPLAAPIPPAVPYGGEVRPAAYALHWPLALCSAVEYPLAVTCPIQCTGSPGPEQLQLKVRGSGVADDIGSVYAEGNDGIGSGTGATAVLIGAGSSAGGLGGGGGTTSGFAAGSCA
jgi:hypothetical protein